MEMIQSTTSGDLQSLVDNLEVALLIIGQDDKLVRYVNRRVCRDLSKSPAEVEGKSYQELFWPEFVSVYERLVGGTRGGSECATIYYWAEKALWEQVTVRPIIWECAPCILMSITTISEITRSEYRFESMAYFDNLLKLPNGAKLEEDINELANLEKVALIYFEPERFEDINNLYGWENGDSLLKQIRDWLLASESRRMQLYRINNGFALLGRKVTMQDMEDRAKKILHRFASPWTLSSGGNDLLLYCTIRLGLVYGKYIKNEMRNLLLRTIRSTNNAGAGYFVYDEAADLQAKRSLIVREDLIGCVHNGMRGFSVHYQPIVDVKTQQWVALEALSRWTTPSGHSVSPTEFINIAEQLNLIDQFDRWVRKTAMQQCVSLQLDKKKFLLDVNFSPTQKIDDVFVDSLFESIHETKFPATKLNLEITESAKMVFDDDNVKGLERLKERGVILSLDDFGTGYSTFANLIKISAHTLKTDKLFLDGIERDSYRQYLLRILVDVAHHLDMQLVTEGVENREQFELLRQYNVDFAQGYLFSKPLSFDNLKAEVWRFK